MTIQDMHYDFKKKLNKVDSQGNPNLRIPEIDWALNEGMNLFIKMVAKPRAFSHLGFETSQRIIDDIRKIVVNNDCITVTDNLAVLPEQYWHYLKAYVTANKETCGTKKIRVFIQQHDDMFEEDSFKKSSFEWEEVNATFNQEGIKLYTDNTFTISEICLSYIRKPLYMHNAANFGTGTYNLPSGVTLTGTQDCELSEHTHSEIVDLAVAITSGEMQLPDLQTKIQKLNFNQL